MEKTVKSIMDKDLIDADDIREEFEVMRDMERPENSEEMIQEVQGYFLLFPSSILIYLKVLRMLQNAPRDIMARGDDDGMDVSDNEGLSDPPQVSTRGRGRGRGSRARGRGRGANE
jgi:hypothetical protein